MEAERAGELTALYGEDVLLLVGGSLYREAGTMESGTGLLEARARSFSDSVRSACGPG